MKSAFLFIKCFHNSKFSRNLVKIKCDFIKIGPYCDYIKRKRAFGQEESFVSYLGFFFPLRESVKSMHIVRQAHIAGKPQITSI